MKYTFTHLGAAHTVDLAPQGDSLLAQIDGNEYRAEVHEFEDGRLEITLDGRTITLHAAADGALRWVAADGRTFELRQEARNPRRGHPASDSPEGILRAPMPGQVRAVSVAAGETVQKGQPLLILEAMKMEIRIQSPCDGTVSTVLVDVGQQVGRDQILIEVK